MKKMSVRLLSAVMGILFLFSATAFAAGMDYEIINPFDAGITNFDGGSLGNRLTVYTNPSVDVDGVMTPAAEIIPEAGNPDNYVLHFNNLNSALTTTSAYYNYLVPGTNTTEGKVHLSMDINMQSKTGAGWTRLYFDSNDGNTALLYVEISPQTGGSSFAFAATDGSGTAWISGGALAANVWYTLHFELNYTKGTYRTWAVNKETGLIHRNTVLERLLKTAGTTNIRGLSIRNRYNANAVFDIDNIHWIHDKVTLKTEPVITVDAGKVKAAAAVRNEFNAAVDSPALILAAYDENKALIDVAVDNRGGEKIPVTPVGTTVGLNCALDVPAQAYTAKAFVWTAVTGLVAFCEPAKHPAE